MQQTTYTNLNENKTQSIKFNQILVSLLPIVEKKKTGAINTKEHSPSKHLNLPTSLHLFFRFCLLSYLTVWIICTSILWPNPIPSHWLEDLTTAVGPLFAASSVSSLYWNIPISEQMLTLKNKLWSHPFQLLLQFPLPPSQQNSSLLTISIPPPLIWLSVPFASLAQTWPRPSLIPWVVPGTYSIIYPWPLAFGHKGDRKSPILPFWYMTMKKH